MKKDKAISEAIAYKSVGVDVEVVPHRVKIRYDGDRCAGDQMHDGELPSVTVVRVRCNPVED
ncbi:hypothetical protein LOC67_23285 [Stieleria sp. JC731]|uniref:hypothetical protein n=1 Tax=Pirellulaceae TaxID=2691357 RepID=UPI001E34833E|nr:hypothetical protein [Stieleria sp. JC731]MCC9603483.1 hypothetical protein [Stieleria sp. JC731]